MAKKLKKDGYGNTPDVTITDAAHASSTAPVNYFNKTALLKNCDSSYWDGAIAGYNNPVLAATVEAIINGIEQQDIQVFSIGTGTAVLPAGDAQQSFSSETLKLKLAQKEGLFSDIRKLATSIISAPPDAASYIAYTMLNPTHAVKNIPYNNFVRANPQIQPVLDTNNKWNMPGGLTECQFSQLLNLDMDATNQEDVDLIVRFTSLWLEDRIPNQSIRMDAHLVPLIGQANFSQVKQLVQEYFL